MATKVTTPASQAGAAAPRRRNDRSEAASEATPDVGGSTTAPASKVRAEPAYILVAWPERWDVMEGLVVPICSHLRCSPGANAVDQDRAGRPLLQLALAQVKEKGGTPIPWDVDGKGTSYLKKVKSTGSWISKWQTQYEGSANVRIDSKGYAEWLRSLIDRRHIPDPQPYALEPLIDRLKARILALTRKSAVGNADLIAQAKADLAAVEAELERVDSMPVEADDGVPDVGL